MQLYSKKVKKHKLHAIKINKVFISINVCLISNLVNTKASTTKISGKKVHHNFYPHVWSSMDTRKSYSKILARGMEGHKQLSMQAFMG